MNTRTKEIAGFPGYVIDVNGAIYSYRKPGGAYGQRRATPRKLKPWTNCSGYRMVSLMRDAKTYRYAVHRLVALAFIPPDPIRPHVNHKNGIKNDNRLENLEWSNKSENGLHSYRVIGRPNPKGEERYFAKLTEDKVREIRRRRAEGEHLKTLAIDFGVCTSTIVTIAKRTAWKHVV